MDLFCLYLILRFYKGISLCYLCRELHRKISMLNNRTLRLFKGARLRGRPRWQDEQSPVYLAISVWVFIKDWYLAVLVKGRRLDRPLPSSKTIWDTTAKTSFRHKLTLNQL